MYQLIKPSFEGQEATCVKRLADNAFIPFDPANTDYQTFKKDIAEGKPLQDADGNEMTAEAAQEFMRNLP
jgi:hypothetical protein